MVAVIWIDWYAYHVARFRALQQHAVLRGKVCGIELVGGCGVHAGQHFRASERDGLSIATLAPHSNWTDAGQRRLAIAVWRKLQRVNPSLVLVPGYYTLPAIVAAIWARVHRRRSVLMSETTRQDVRRVWWKELCKSLLLRSLFERAIAGGKPHLRYLRELGFKPASLACAYDVVDNEYYKREARHIRANRKAADFRLPQNFFLYVGRLSLEKNVGGLINAFRQYYQTGGSWSLVVAGDGPLRRELVSRVRDARLEERVIFTGFKRTNELPPYYALARCFVLPSTREPWGLVANEAMASGLPVLLSTRCGCAEDLVQAGRNGFVFDPDNTHALASLMLEMSGRSEEELDEMGKRSQEIIARYSPEVWATEVARLVSECD